jgi:hypothetical protein
LRESDEYKMRTPCEIVARIWIANRLNIILTYFSHHARRELCSLWSVRH